MILFTQPQKQAGEGPWWTAGLFQDPDAEGDEIVLAKSLPPLWKGQYQGHYVAVEEVGGADPDNEISHLALLESFEYGENDPIYFGPQAVTHNGMILWFSEKRQKFYKLHCRECGMKILRWMLKNQETWEKNALPGVVGRA